MSTEHLQDAMTIAFPEGNVSVSIIAGPLKKGAGNIFLMGDMYLHIQPDVAAQWIKQLTPLAESRAAK